MLTSLVKAIRRYHFIHTRMAIIIKTKTSVGGCGEIGTPYIAGGTASLKKSRSFSNG